MTSPLKKDESAESGADQGAVLTPQFVATLKKKIDEHDTARSAAPELRPISLEDLKTVAMRAAKRMGSSNQQLLQDYALARVNAFLHLARTGSPADPKYTEDNDLLRGGQQVKALGQSISEQRGTVGPQRRNSNGGNQERYRRDVRDADGDGVVQEGTDFERRDQQEQEPRSRRRPRRRPETRQRTQSVQQAAQQPLSEPQRQRRSGPKRSYANDASVATSGSAAGRDVPGVDFTKLTPEQIRAYRRGDITLEDIIEMQSAKRNNSPKKDSRKRSPKPTRSILSREPKRPTNSKRIPAERQIAGFASADKKFTEIEQSVREKYGDIGLLKNAAKAMKQAFPNAADPFGLESESAKDSSRPKRIDANEQGKILGLLYGAMLNPSAAERATEIVYGGKQLDRTVTATGHNAAAICYGNGSGTFGLAFHTDDSNYFVNGKNAATNAAKSKNGFKEPSYERYYKQRSKDSPISLVIAGMYYNGILAEKKNPKEAIRQKSRAAYLANAYMALHEFSHGIHYSAIFKDIETNSYEIVRSGASRLRGGALDSLSEQDGEEALNYAAFASKYAKASVMEAFAETTAYKFLGVRTPQVTQPQSDAFDRWYQWSGARTKGANKIPIGIVTLEDGTSVLCSDGHGNPGFPPSPPWTFSADSDSNSDVDVDGAISELDALISVKRMWVDVEAKAAKQKLTRAQLLREPYNPNAIDGDGDGIVQEGTIWERPVGTRFINHLGQDLKRGLKPSQYHPTHRLVDGDGNNVDYTPGLHHRKPGAGLGQRIGERVQSVGSAARRQRGATPTSTTSRRDVSTPHRMERFDQATRNAMLRIFRDGVVVRKKQPDGSYKDVKFKGSGVSFDASVERAWRALLHVSAEDFTAGNGWYREQNATIRSMAERLGVSEDIAFGVVAATSVKMAWDDNVKGKLVMPNLDIAETLIKNLPTYRKKDAVLDDKIRAELGIKTDLPNGRYKIGDLPNDVAAHFVRIEVQRDLGYDYGLMAGPVAAAMNIIDTSDVDTHLGGPKVRSFYDNLRFPGQSDAVTIDSLMTQFLAHVDSKAAGELIKRNVKDVRVFDRNGVHVTSYGAYAVMAEIINRITERWNDEHEVDRHLSPADVQAILWYIQRNKPTRMAVFRNAEKVLNQRRTAVARALNAKKQNPATIAKAQNQLAEAQRAYDEAARAKEIYDIIA